MKISETSESGTSNAVVGEGLKVGRLMGVFGGDTSMSIFIGLPGERRKSIIGFIGLEFADVDRKHIWLASKRP